MGGGENLTVAREIDRSIVILVQQGWRENEIYAKTVSRLWRLIVDILEIRKKQCRES